MKTLMATMAIALSTVFGPVHADIRSELTSKIEESVRTVDRPILIPKGHKDFVKMSFRIDAAGKLEILEMNYSDAQLKDLMVEKLSEIRIVGERGTDEVFHYQFTFELE